MNRHDGSPSSVFSDICTASIICVLSQTVISKHRNTLTKGTCRRGVGTEETEELQEDKELTLLFPCACSRKEKKKKKKYVKQIYFKIMRFFMLDQNQNKYLFTDIPFIHIAPKAHGRVKDSTYIKGNHTFITLENYDRDFPLSFYLKYLKYREPGQKALVWIGNKWAVSMKGKVFSMSACPFLTAPPPTCQAVENFISQCIFKQTLHPWFQRRWGEKKRKREEERSEWFRGDRASRPRYDLHLYHSFIS